MDIPLSNGKVAIIDDADYPLVSGYRWYCYPGKYGTYAQAHGKREDGRRTTVKMHQIVAGKGADHIDRDGLNNRRGNLRPATQAQNTRNRGPNAGSGTGYKGVTKARGKYRAQIISGGVYRSLGVRDTPEEAARLYNMAAKELHGDFAYQNVLDS